jgi:N-methylhydantoinase A
MRVASDIGGTFTDLVYLEESTGETAIGKSSTVPSDLSSGVVHTIIDSKLPVEDTSFFVHGSTVVINLLTERKGAKTGLITTRGFRDVLEITRANRPDLYNMHYTKPKPFVPRRYRLEAGGRINFKGEELAPLCEEDIFSAGDFFLKEGIEAIAVCFLHSYANPIHERRCGEILREILPGIPFTLSSDITREWREYERTNTAVLNSYVQKRTAEYLENLENRLHRMGMNKVFHIMQSNGGTATFEHGCRAPINMVESGPVGGVIGTAVLGAILGEKNLISFDVGGTTAKTSLIPNGNPVISTDYKIEWNRHSAGYPILAPTVDIIEIGSGGGSIARIDDGGALRVGPESAGADPGPSCYGKGGKLATVTDAQVAAGRINPEYFLGGSLTLEAYLSRNSLNPIAGAFSISTEEAAMGVIRIADSAMVNALKLVSVSRGYDPRDFILVAFGGGGPLHAASVIREMSLKKAIIPQIPGVFSAWGMLMSDLRQDFIKTLILRTDRITPGDIEEMFAGMEEQAMKLMMEQNIGKSRIVFRRFADMRYTGQEHTVKVPLAARFLEQSNITDMNSAFHKIHEQAYSFRLKSSIEIVNCHLICTGRVAKTDPVTVSPQGLSHESACTGTRTVIFNDFGEIISNIYRRDLMPIDIEMEGPAVIEEQSSTTLVFPDQKVRRDKFGFLHIEQK